MADDLGAVALFRYLPQLVHRVPWARLGTWPTPLVEVRLAGAPVWIKREGDSSALYGGNKVRTLEAWLGHARARGARRIWAIGAYGSNHVIATILHARAVGLDAGAIVFPQPGSAWAFENAGAMIDALHLASGKQTASTAAEAASTAAEAASTGGEAASTAGEAASTAGEAASTAGKAASTAAEAASTAAEAASTAREAASTAGEAASTARHGAAAARTIPLVRLRSVVEVPFVGARIAARERDSIVMPPGGATPIGTLGALSAALEVAEQVAAGAAPPPARIVVAAGSTCTTAGLLAGFALARALGVWRARPPIIHAVRVTPWPVTSTTMILQLAAWTLVRIAMLGGPHVSLLRNVRLVVDRGEIGRGYGRLTQRATDVMAECARDPAWPRLDGVYSGKAASALLRLQRAGEGPLLFWATKSATELSPPSLDALRAAPRPLVEWLS